MNSTLVLIIIILGVVLAFILYKIFKPYIIRHDTTLLFTGGLGSGKSLSSVKQAIVLIRKNRFLHYKMHNHFKVKRKNWYLRIFNHFRKRNNEKWWNKLECKKIDLQTYKKHFKQLHVLAEKRKLPQLYSNIPVHFKKHIFSPKREWAQELTEAQLLCLEKQREYSVVLIDELPQFINQFNWNEELIQKNVNEYITFFRHYVGGYLIVNAQAVDDVVCQIRRKLNQATWCFNFKKHLFGLFYTIEMCDIMMSDQVSTMTTTFIEDNTRKCYGLFPPKNTYNTRCYSERYKNCIIDYQNKRHKNVKTNKVLRLIPYISPLDDNTTEQEKENQIQKMKKLTASQRSKE